MHTGIVGLPEGKRFAKDQLNRRIIQNVSSRKGMGD
jgi:hypothetical protein